MVKKKRMEGSQEPDLTPAMNLILIIIPLLLTAMETMKMTVINVATPQIGPSSAQATPDQPQDEKPLKLTLALTDRGITVFAKDQVIENKNDPLGPTIPKIDGEEIVDGKPINGKVYDLAKLQEMLKDIKSQHPTEENLIISAEPHIKYKYIIKVMDSSRERKEGEKKETMFPNVVLSAGVA